MNRPAPRPLRAARVFWLPLCAFTLLAPVSATQAASLNLASAPLANATTTQVLPNIMFTLDDSGSMAWDFMPDWVGDDFPRSSNPQLYKNAGLNVAYYNPAIRYEPPVMFTSTGALDTATYPSLTSGWNAVRYDAFGKQSSSVVAYPAQLCPNGSTPAGGGTTQTCNLVGGADYYSFVAGEYCTKPDLKVCVTQAAPTATYPFPGNLRWCKDAALTDCQVTRTSVYLYPRYPGMPPKATLTVGGSGTNRFTSIKVGGQEILSVQTSSTSTASTLATNIRNGINACTAAITGNCTVAGYSAVRSGSVVTVTAPSGSSITLTPTWTRSGTGNKTITASAFSGGVPGSIVHVDIVSGTTSYPYPGTTAKHANRSDCAGTTCTYSEEMTNFANWFAYYHTRMQMMKSGVSRSFKSISSKFRVGFNSISYTGASSTSSKFLDIDKFETTHKYNWYVKLFSAVPSSATPLRGALSKVGKLYANKLAGANDPLQYSCQQNFSILSTDGYWNTNNEVNSTTSTSYGPDKLDNTDVGNLDGGTTARPMYEGPTATSNSLADVAKYYYDTDLRDTALGNCTGALGFDVCENNVFVSTTDNNVKQHMTSFTIGLGADGTLNYQSDYLTATSGDFYDLKNGLLGKNWPNPIANTGAERIDDLWHAAVNGQGQYFSAKNPNDIVDGLNTALASISSKIGSGAAAATSTLNPVTGDNGVFVASYTTVKWYGNLEKRLMDTDTGVTSETAQWCVEDVVAGNCNPPGALEHDTSGGSDVWYCVTPGATTCPDGTMVGTDCKVEVARSCTGTLKSKVAAATDSRKIFMKVGGGLADFSFANVGAEGLDGNYANSFLSANLSQAATMSAAQKANLTGPNLVAFLRGQTGYEERASNTADQRVFRYREATLGDAVESQPAYLGKPPFNYADSGYSAFVAAQTPPARIKTVFLGTNDGMLHAFNADTGDELWAYVPSMVIPNLWKLAEKNYSTAHSYFVNGSAMLSDVKFGDGSWHSILVGSLKGGGRGYYALDVTDPTNPGLLWEFTPTQDADLGYSFGDAVITKRPADGKWVVLLTSGYNNTGPGDGKGYLYSLDAQSGAILAKTGTGVGSTVTPSGFSKIAAWSDNAEKDNTTKWVYGGDLQGNLWRFDMTSGAVLRLAILRDPGGTVQPITTRPELAKINDKRVVFVGTGKYLELTDLTTTQKQTFYAIKDDDATVTFDDPRIHTIGADKMVAQVLTNVGATREVTACNTSFSFVSDRGYYIDFPDLYTSATMGTSASERANIDPQLQFGTLLVPTTVPASDVCSPGGYGWLNYVDYKNGCQVAGSTDAGQKTNSPIVGMNVVTLPPKPGVSINERIKVSVVTADNPTPQLIGRAPFNATLGSFVGKRMIWRELMR